MKKLLITMLVLMFAVACCSCSPKTAPDTPKPNSDNPTLIVDPTDDAALSTTTFFSAENSTVFTTETTAVATSVTDTTKQPTKTSTATTTSSKTAAKTTKATTKSETVTTKKTTAATTVTTRTTKKTTQTTVTVPTTTKTTKAPTTTVKPTTAKPTTTKTTAKTTTRTTTKATTTTTAAPRTMTISEAESYANAYLQSLGMEIDYSATPSNAAYLPPMTWDEGDTYEAMQARIRSHIDNTIAWRGLQAGDPMRAVAEYHPNEYDATYGWLYILH